MHLFAKKTDDIPLYARYLPFLRHVNITSDIGLRRSIKPYYSSPLRGKREMKPSAISSIVRMAELNALMSAIMALYFSTSFCVILCQIGSMIFSCRALPLAKTH